MTSLRRKPISFGARRSTTEQEREAFLKSQEASFRKAINDEECPIKMKHVRNLIIGTHTDHSGIVFWDLVALSPPLHTDITAWKFCHTLHLILRDGHLIALRDSVKHIGKIQNLGEHFKHLPTGYGHLIEKYCSLLVSKLQFHDHYPKFPGTLQISKEELHSIAENDPNSYFEMAVEVLEYMENILNLYEVVFQSLDPSRANSMTKTGQCRLSPLIPCIQDSSLLYDLLVRLLFRLHKEIPSDMLSGHRTRFNQQFKVLQGFYNNTRNLQYFKTLIQVPHLPQVPPNFMVQAELRSHVTPVVVLEEEDPGLQDTSLMLVETADSPPPPVPPHPHPDAVNSYNGAAAELLAERESMIEVLQGEIRQQRNLIHALRSEHSHATSQHKFEISELESTIAELESELSAEKKSKESVLVQVEAASANAEAATKLSEAENGRRTAEEKFLKMKEVYQKLRDEHISLIRMKAEMEKCFAEEKRKLASEIEKNSEKDIALKRLEKDLSQQEGLREQQEYISAEEKSALEKQVNILLEEKDRMAASKDSLQKEIDGIREERKLDSQEAHTELLNAQSELMSRCLNTALDSSTSSIRLSLSHFDNEFHRLIKSTPEYTLLYCDPMLTCLEGLMSDYLLYADGNCLLDPSPKIIQSASDFGRLVSHFLLYAKATAHASPHIDIAESLVPSLEIFANDSLEVLEKISHKSLSKECISSITKRFYICCDLVRKCEDLTPTREDMAGILEKEIETMNHAIAEAVEKFSRLLVESRANDTGMQLEVNEKILAACSDLMAAVRVLVQRASELQQEIVAAGRGGASPKDFYKRNHRWTEGLISGAKAVGIACQALVQAADDVIGGRGKFEHVIVASREIAACSMQLVMSSRVKADKDSPKLGNLNVAAKSISTLTASVVATAESCREKVTETAALDFSKLSLHSMKKLEMETLVKVLETEKLLETEREKLGELRRYHYQLAGDTENLENEAISPN